MDPTTPGQFFVNDAARPFLSLPQPVASPQRPSSVLNTALDFPTYSATSSLLGKTGKFVPTPVGLCCHRKILAGVDDFLRTYQWRFVNFRASSRPRFSTKSDRYPPQQLIPSRVLRQCAAIREEVAQALRQCRNCFPHDNLSPDERLELKRLTSDPSIAVTPVDKGSGWMIFPTAFYDAEAFRQLTNEAFYKPVQENIDLHVGKRMKVLLSQLYEKKFLSRREMTALQPPAQPSSRTLFMLPKIHKPSTSWSFSCVPPARPIVSDVGSVTRACAALLEHFLAPLAQQGQSYVRDSLHVIAIIEDTFLNDSSLLVTLDIVSLYTNIPTENGIAAVAKAFQRYPDRRRPDLTLLTMLRIILTHNAFLFRGEQFLQTQGTAMGCAFGSSYANIFLSDWEDVIFAHHRPPVWLRYIDDIFIVWDFPSSELTNFCNFINSIYDTIKVEMQSDEQSIRFLDLVIKRQDFRLSYSIGFKPTDTHCLLPPSSFHPRHIFSAILFGQVYRWATRSASYSDFCATKATVQSHWRGQGYTRHAIRSAIRRVFKLTGQSPEDWDTGFFPCPISCSICTYGFFTRKVTNVFTKISYLLLHKLNCKSVNVVYLISCKRCFKGYVGQTSVSLRRRMQQHLDDIASHRPTPVSEHFNGSCGPSDFSFSALEHSPNLAKRLEKENAWMRRLQTLQPDGLNTQLNTSRALHLVVPYSHCARDAARRVRSHVKDFCSHVSYTRHRNLRSILSSNLRQPRESSVHYEPQ